MKGKIDYKSKSYPHTRHIVDLVRCSVVFDTIEDLVKGYNTFYNKHRNFSESEKGVTRIVRIKNDFSEYTGDLSEYSLNEFKYSDIKFNVIVHGARDKIVGEIQFLPKFMLEAKKMGHSMYSFVRNEDSFLRLGKLINKNDSYGAQNVIPMLTRIILSRNMKQFSLFFETMDMYEKFQTLKNKQSINKLLKENNWKKGEKLFATFVDQQNM